MFLQLQPKTFIFMDCVATRWGQYGYSSPSTKGLHGFNRTQSQLWIGFRAWLRGFLQTCIHRMSRKYEQFTSNYARRSFIRLSTVHLKQHTIKCVTNYARTLWKPKRAPLIRIRKCSKILATKYFKNDQNECK